MGREQRPVGQHPDAYPVPPDFHKRFESMPQQDKRFLNDIARRYKKRDEVLTPNPFENLSVALSELVLYGGTLEATNPITLQGIVFTTEKEITGSMNVRLNTLSNLFLNVPAIKRSYNKFHAEKMARALPNVITSIDAFDTDTFTTRTDYLKASLSAMNESMVEVAGTYDSNFINNLGTTINFNQKGFRDPDNNVEVVGKAGNGTFINFLDGIIDEAVTRDEDLDAKLKDEFLPKKGKNGVIWDSMNTTLEALLFVVIPIIQDDDLDGARKYFDTHVAPEGRCPATLRGRQEDGTLTDRPIVYEYASAIVKRMPRRFLQKVS